MKRAYREVFNQVKAVARKERVMTISGLYTNALIRAMRPELVKMAWYSYAMRYTYPMQSRTLSFRLRKLRNNF